MICFKNIIFTICATLSLTCWGQKNKQFDLSTSKKSFENLSLLLSIRDTINLKSIVTESAYEGFHFENIDELENLGKSWLTKDITVINSSSDMEIVKVDDYAVPICFIKELHSNEWKFSKFVFKPE